MPFKVNKSVPGFSSNTSLGSYDENHSFFKWWLAPEKAKIRQGNVQVARQLEEIKDMRKELRKLKRASIQDRKLCESIAQISKLKSFQSRSSRKAENQIIREHKRRPSMVSSYVSNSDAEVSQEVTNQPKSKLKITF